MTVKTTIPPEKPPGRIKRAIHHKRAAARGAPRPYIPSLPAVAALALIILAVAPGLLCMVLLPAGAVLGIAADRLRMHAGWHLRNSRMAAWKRRRHQGPASWPELRARAFRPRGGGIPICTVTRGQTR